MLYILMGVSGSGKTTVGKVLADRLEGQFHDADDFHPSTNIQKMRAGIPLSDSDRLPWLYALQEQIDQWSHNPLDQVLACSALKKQYRQILNLNLTAKIKIIYLKANKELLQKRLSSRKNHFFNPDLLADQFNNLEEPENALIVDAHQSIKKIVHIILTH